MELSKLKEQAEINALRKLQIQFNTHDQLEQIEQHMHLNEKRKNMIETQLKSAIQSHFISVSTCMEQLKDVIDSLGEVKQNIYSIQEEYKTISHLENTLGELRREATKHKQLKSAKENVKNILNVEDLAEQASQHIEQNKLLLAHKCLLDMEKCRNDILEELYNPNDKNTNVADVKLVDDFFKQVKEIQNLLRNHIFVTIKRMLEVSKSYPEQLVTALRIIEREEVLDEYWMKKKEETGFAPSDRPRNWRQECKNIMKQIVEAKIHGCRIEERDTDESWFAKHLGNICTRLVQDLEVVKKLCEPCFPPSYKIFDYFVSCVHDIVAEYLKQLLDTNQLKDQEYFILLSWQDTYKSDCFMGHPSLHLDTSKLQNLLDEEYYTKALEAHIGYTKRRISSWFKNAIEKNVNDWITNVAPYTIEGNFESSMPNDINTMLIQQLDLMNYANDDRFSKETLAFLIDEINVFIEILKGKVVEFKVNHFKNPEILKNSFTVRMVTISNDCVRLKDCFITIRNKYDKFMDKDEVGGPNDQYEIVGNKVVAVGDICLEFIIEDMIKCLDEHYFKELLTREWLTNDKIITTIIETSSDYMNDLIHLRPESQLTILVKWHNRIKVEYMKGFLQNLTRVLRKCQFTDPNERTLLTTKVTKEVYNLEQWFQNMTSTIAENKNNFDFSVITLMNKIIKADDIDFIGVEIGALIKKCPDMNSDMLYALLSLRGDISKSDYKDKFEDYVTAPETPQSTNPYHKTPTTPKPVKTDEAMLILKKELKIQQ